MFRELLIWLVHVGGVGKAGGGGVLGVKEERGAGSEGHVTAATAPHGTQFLSMIRVYTFEAAFASRQAKCLLD